MRRACRLGSLAAKGPWLCRLGVLLACAPLGCEDTDEVGARPGGSGGTSNTPDASVGGSGASSGGNGNGGNGSGGRGQTIPDVPDADTVSPCPGSLPALGATCASPGQRCYYCDDADGAACAEAAVCTSAGTWQDRHCPVDRPPNGESCLTPLLGPELGESFCIYGTCGVTGGVVVSECVADGEWEPWASSPSCPAVDAGIDAGN